MKRMILCVLGLLFAGQAMAAETTLRINKGSEEFKRGGQLYWQQIVNPAAADTDLVVAVATTSTSSGTTWMFSAAENALFNQSVPGRARNVTLTMSGIDANIDGGTDPVLTGTNLLGETITETFDVTENTAATITGAKAFATLTSLSVPAQDGASVYFSVGPGNIFGLHSTLTSSIQKLGSAVDGTSEAGTLAVSATAIESNTWLPSTVANGTRDYLIFYALNPYATTATSTRGW